MIHGKNFIVVMPTYNAEKTLEDVYKEIPFEYGDAFDDAYIHL